MASIAPLEIVEARIRRNSRVAPRAPEDDHYKKERRSINRALVTIFLITTCYVITACLSSFLFGGTSPISSGEIIFIMVVLSMSRALFSILIPIYNFDPIWQLVKEYYGQTKFVINDLLEGIYLYFR